MPKAANAQTHSEARSGQQARSASPQAGESFRDRAMRRLSGDSSGERKQAPTPKRQPTDATRERQQHLREAQAEKRRSRGEAEDEHAAEQEAAQQHEADREDDAGVNAQIDPEDEAEGSEAETELETEDESEAETEDEPESVEALRAEVERLTKRETERNADYTRKTQKIAAGMRQLETEFEGQRRTAGFLSQVFDSIVAPWANVDWATLQTQDPAKYQQARGQYEQAVTAQRRLQQARADIDKQHKEATERAKAAQAGISIELLAGLIPGYGESDERRAEVYASIRDFAVTRYGFTREEIDDHTDHKLLHLLHDAMQAHNPERTLKGVRREVKAKAPKGAPNRPAPRGAGGQFQSARQHAWQNPGNRQAINSYFKRKLEADRNRNR